jgi:RNA polymerase sigma factor (sigma-70 family)
MVGPNLGGVLRRLRRLVGSGAEVDALSDAHLLDRFVASRDEAVFAELVDRHGSMVLGVARCVLNDTHAAEDVFQATFLVLARKAGTVRKQASVGSWLYGVAYRIARNAKVSAARRRQREREVPPVSAAGEEAMPNELGPLLSEELSRLPEKYRAPLVLCYLEGKTNEEAAGALGWPSGTVKGRLARGREMLRTRLARRALVLSAGTIAAELTQTTAHAAVSPAIAEATISAAALFAAGGAAAASVAPEPVLELCQQALKEMVMIRLRSIAISLVAVVALGVGVSWAALRAPVVPGGAPDPKAVDDAKQVAEAPAADDEPIPDGARGRIGTVRLRHAGPIEALAFAKSEERPYLASASTDGSVVVWDARTGKEVRRFAVNPTGTSRFFGRWNSLAISPDGTRLAAAAADNFVTVWEIATGKQLHRFAGSAVAFAPDNKQIAVGAMGPRKQQGPVFQGGGEGVIHLYDAETGEKKRTIPANDFTDYTSLAFAPNGKQLFVAGSNVQVQVGRIPVPGQLPAPVKPGQRPPTKIDGGAGIGFGAGADFLQSTFMIGCWDLETGKQVYRVTPEKDELWAFAVSPDGKLLVTAGTPVAKETSATMTLRDAATGKERGTLKGHTGLVTSMCFSPDGKHLVSSASDCTIRLWDVQSGKELGRAVASRSNVRAVAFGPGGRTVASAGAEYVVRLWDVSIRKEASLVDGPALKERVRAPGHDGFISFLGYTGDGKCLITGGTFDPVQAWDATARTRLQTLANTYVPGPGALSPDGKLIIAGTHDQAIRIYEVESGKEVCRLGKRQAMLKSAAFTPDSKFVLVSAQALGKNSVDGEVKLWNVATGKEVRSYRGVAPQWLHIVPWADTVRIAPHGKTAALQWTMDPTIQLVDLNSGKVLRRITGPEETAISRARFGTTSSVTLTFSPDGKYLATAHAAPSIAAGNPGLLGGFGPAAATDYDGTRGVILWDAATGKEIARLSKESVRTLAFSPDSKSLATADSFHGDIRVWDVPARKERCRFNGCRDGITALTFAPDGRTLAAGGRDTSVVLWDVPAK